MFARFCEYLVLRCEHAGVNYSHCIYTFVQFPSTETGCLYCFKVIIDFVFDLTMYLIIYGVLDMLG